MSEQSLQSIAIVCEAAADQKIACGLADRVLCDQVDWITQEVIDAYRAYRGLEPCAPFLVWSQVPALAKARRIKAHGHFAGRPGAPDALAGRRALLLLVGSSRVPDVVLLIRDTDGDWARLDGLNQARDSGNWTFEVIIGVAHSKRESWVLAGFEPQNDKETDLLQQLRQELGFDARTGADGLGARAAHAKRDAKRVLHALTQGIQDREDACWKNTSLATLEAHGEHTGLRDYLCELRTRLVPLFLATTRS